MRHIGRLALTCLIGVLSPVAHADISAEMAQASTPLSEGVPEVAVVRLQSLLNKDLPESQWRAVAEKLAEAQMAANEPEATLVLLTDARLRDGSRPFGRRRIGEGRNGRRRRLGIGRDRLVGHRRNPTPLPAVRDRARSPGGRAPRGRSPLARS